MMKNLKDFLVELLHADSVTEVLMENRKETVKLAAVLVVVMLAVLLYLHQGSAELAVTEADSGAGTNTAAESAGGYAEGDAAENGNMDADAKAGLPLDTDGIVYVDIGGAVKNPQLAELPSGSRVEDAIEAAGGLTKDADLSEVNRAALLTDGEKIYIPEEGEETAAAGASGGGSSGGGSVSAVGITGGRININTADEILLQQLTGVGPVTAQKIVDYREQHGKFKAIEELKNVSGIGEKTFEKMRDDVTI